MSGITVAALLATALMPIIAVYVRVYGNLTCNGKYIWQAGKIQLFDKDEQSPDDLVAKTNYFKYGNLFKFVGFASDGFDYYEDVQPYLKAKDICNKECIQTDVLKTTLRHVRWPKVEKYPSQMVRVEKPWKDLANWKECEEPYGNYEAHKYAESDAIKKW